MDHMRPVIFVVFLLVSCGGTPIADLSMPDAQPDDQVSDASVTEPDASAADAATTVADASSPDSQQSCVDAGVPDAQVHVFSKLFIVGDSIPIYCGGCDQSLTAIGLMTATYPGVLVNNCIGGQDLYPYVHDDASLTFTANRIIAAAPSEVYIELGFNDWSTQKWPSVTEFEARYKLLVQRLRAENLTVYCQTLYVHSTNPGPTGFSLDEASQAIRNACVDGAIVVEADTFGILPTLADHVDWIHLNTVGHAKLAAGISIAIGW